MNDQNSLILNFLSDGIKKGRSQSKLLQTPFFETLEEIGNIQAKKYKEELADVAVCSENETMLDYEYIFTPIFKNGISYLKEEGGEPNNNWLLDNSQILRDAIGIVLMTKRQEEKEHKGGSKKNTILNKVELRDLIQSIIKQIHAGDSYLKQVLVKKNKDVLENDVILRKELSKVNNAFLSDSYLRFYENTQERISCYYKLLILLNNDVALKNCSKRIMYKIPSNYKCKLDNEACLEVIGAEIGILLVLLLDKNLPDRYSFGANLTNYIKHKVRTENNSRVNKNDEDNILNDPNNNIVRNLKSGDISATQHIDELLLKVELKFRKIVLDNIQKTGLENKEENAEIYALSCINRSKSNESSKAEMIAGIYNERHPDRKMTAELLRQRIFRVQKYFPLKIAEIVLRTIIKKELYE